MRPEVTVSGFRELQTLFAKAGPAANREVRVLEREVAEPIRSDAQMFATTGITRIGPQWSRMRVGITRTVVYVAPRQRGSRGRTPRSRPRFAALMDQRAMTPAADRNRPLLEARVERLFDQIADRWNVI